jgi:hypothetical protein
VISGIVACGIILLLNIAAFAYTYGRLSQKVDNNTKRLERIEGLLNHHCNPDVKGG